MPELPEVETIARVLKPKLAGRIILEADVRWARTVAIPSARKFKELVMGQKIADVSRRAKYLIIQFEPRQQLQDRTYSLLVHLRMSGDLFLREGKIEPQKHDRLILTLTPDPSSVGKGGTASLVFNDTRKFGRVWLTDNIENVLGSLGPEPFSDEFTPQWLYENLRARHRQLKPLLLDQTFLAGLGNIYTDECLHMSKLHPLAASDTVKPKQAEALHRSIRAVLEEGIRRNGASIDWVYRGGGYQNHFRVYDREGQPCFVCGRKIQRLVVGQRGTHVCPNCQKLR
ncbi:MAG: bifunctional DNA-formamidopyrimidine glycosylase/DNA-(apurinic or apyrimidinic site) lyase [Chloroflexi bacterium]|nr:bifunctional DNA-formamidopyrimidine glycosylase/DNA-(apurinic or apyrimidinic site) lyase [Chloroflexota bacterium]